MHRIVDRLCNVPTSLRSIATTHQGRPVYVLTMGSTTREAPTRVLVTAGMHGRERSTSLVALYAVERLCRKPQMLRGVEVLFVPVVNPDGQELARGVMKEWRKNGRYLEGCNYFGVDLNRNWPAFWDTYSMPKPGRRECQDTYPGPHALSEPETLALAQLVHNVGGIRVHVDIHSFGQCIYRGWTTGIQPNGLASKCVTSTQQHVARAVRMAIRNSSGIDYVDMPVAQKLENTTTRLSGTMLDYMMTLGIPSIAIELAPRWEYQNRVIGFFTNASDILPRSIEVFPMFQVLIDAVRSDYLQPKHPECRGGTAYS